MCSSIYCAYPTRPVCRRWSKRSANLRDVTVPVIVPLTGEADAAAVSDWIWMEWARHEPGVSRVDSDASVHAALHGARMPYFIVARAAGVPVGCASIVATDLPTR